MARLLSDRWYHSMELKPGVFTSPQGHLNVGVTRTLLAGCDVQGKRCLDIGCMEGMMSVLMARRGGIVTAVDGFNETARVDLVRRTLGVSFDYHPFVGSLDLVERLSAIHSLAFAHEGQSDKTGRRQVSPLYFDVIVASGLLYHLWSPFHLLGAVRSLLRPGGILILETAFLHSPDAMMMFNFDGTKYLYEHGSNTWFVTDTLLDHALRLFHLKPIDCMPGWNTSDAKTPGRIAVACRATEGVEARETEFLMSNMTAGLEFSKLLPRTHWAGAPTEEVPYRRDPSRRIVLDQNGSCDLYNTSQNGTIFDFSKYDATLRLGDAA